MRMVISSSAEDRRSALGVIARTWLPARGAGALAAGLPPAAGGGSGDGGGGDGPTSSTSTGGGRGADRVTVRSCAAITATSASAPWTATEAASADLRATSVV